MMKTNDYRDCLTASTTVAVCLATILFTGCGSQTYDGIGTPILILPEDGSTIAQNPPVFVWHRVGDAAEYDLQVADNSFDSLYVLIIDLSCHLDTSHALSGAMNPGTYYWRVQAMAGG
jgi:hypothetical protein